MVAQCSLGFVLENIYGDVFLCISVKFKYKKIYNIIVRSSVECYHSNKVFSPYSRTSRDSGPSCIASKTTSSTKNTKKEKKD